MPSAIVTGVTGILGREIVCALGQDPEQWTTIHALSPSQKEKYASNVEHDNIDLTGTAEGMAKQLKGDVNGAMLKEILDALDITSASKKLERIILSTGAKQHGVHLGAPKEPMEESDLWIDRPGRPPNFYYFQQNTLREKAKGASWDWVVTYPNDRIGVANDNFMNLATSIGLYAAISKELDGNLMFPGSETFYTLFDSFTYSRLHAQFNLWAALEPKCSSQAFNVVNGETESWQNPWSKLAKRLRCHIPRNQFRVDVGKDADSVMPLAENPPIAEVAAQIGLEHGFCPNRVEQKIDLVKWSQRKDVQEAWAKLCEEHDFGKGCV